MSGTASKRTRPDELPHRLQILRRRLAAAGEGHDLTDALVRGLRRLAEPRPSPKVDRLARDDELDRRQALGEHDHLRQPPSGQRGHRDAILDPLVVARARGLDRDRLGEELRLGRERLRRHAELGEGALRQPRLGGETLGQAGDRRLEQLDRSLGRGRQHRREGDSHDVESLGERQRVEVADRDEPSLADEDDGVLLRGVQLRLEPPPRERERVVRGRVELGDAAEAERVLQVPRRTGLQQPASVEERPEAVEHPL